MPRPKQPPQYLKGKPRSGGGHYARTIVDGVEHALGVYGSPESYAELERLRTAWLSRQNGRDDSTITVNDVCARWMADAEERRRKPDGSPKDELVSFKHALRPLARLFGQLPATDFGPECLEELQLALASGSWLTDDERASRTRPARQCLRVVNRNIIRVRTVWRWAEKKRLVPPGSWNLLRTVPGLTPEQAEEHDEVPPVPEDVLAATMPHLARIPRAIVQVQLLTGARPDEVLRLRPCDLERADQVEIGRGVWLKTGGKVWVVRLKDHKTSHRGKKHRRVILIGPQAQEVLRPFLPRHDDAYLFSPLEATLEWLTSRGRKPKRGRGREPKERYTPDSYRKAVAAACDRAFPPPAELAERLARLRAIFCGPKRPDQTPALLAELKAAQRELKNWRKAHRWFPYQLRHNAATRLAQQFDHEIARIVLGHRNIATTMIYALNNLQAATKAMGEAG